jgi:hypothetical protein
MIDRADDDTKTTAFAVAIVLKLVFSAGTDAGRAENQALVERVFGDDIGQPHVTEDENTHRDTDGNLSVLSTTRGPTYRPASPSVASSTMVNRSVDGEEDEDWLDEWTTEDRMARLADTLEAQDVHEDIQDDAEQVESVQHHLTAPPVVADAKEVDNTAVAAAPSTHALASATLPPTKAEVLPVVTTAIFALRDLSATIKTFLLASRSHFNYHNYTYVLEFQKVVEIFGEDNFIRELQQSRVVLCRETNLFKYAQKAGLPGPIFRWVHGHPVDLYLGYSGPHMDNVIEQLTAQYTSGERLLLTNTN